MTTALLVAVVAGAVACPLRMLWALACRRRPSCMVSRDGGADSVTEREQRLAAAVPAVGATREVERSAAHLPSR